MASSRGCGFEPQQRRCVVASIKYLINCLVLVQPDFEINEVLNSILKPTANWSPYIFTIVQKVKHRVYKIHVFLSEAILFRDSVSYFI